jgi:hypothetical protein
MAVIANPHFSFPFSYSFVLFIHSIHSFYSFIILIHSIHSICSFYSFIRSFYSFILLSLFLITTTAINGDLQVTLKQPPKEHPESTFSITTNVLALVLIKRLVFNQIIFSIPSISLSNAPQTANANYEAK